jgi:hypothetical protein
MPVQPRLVAELLQVKPRQQGNSAPVPVISHTGTTYAIADPGTEFELQVKVINGIQGLFYKVRCAAAAAAVAAAAGTTVAAARSPALF